MVSPVTATIAQEATMKAVARRTPRNAPVRLFMPRAAGTWKSTQRTVLVANSQARVQCGASVRSTSQSGITTVSRIQWVPLMPLRTAVATKPLFFRAFGPVWVAMGTASGGSTVSSAISRAGSAASPASCARGSGRREMRAAFRPSRRAVTTGSQRITSWLSEASARPLISAPRVKPMLRAERRNAWFRTRSARGKIAIE